MWRNPYSLHLTMVLLGISLVGVRSVKVKNRFDLNEIARTNLRLLIPEISVWLALNPVDRVPAAFHLLDLVHRLYGGFNRTDSYTSNPVTGISDEYGNYSGMVGSVQRGEADAAFTLVRPDALPFEPVRIGSVICSDELRIFAPKRKGSETHLDVILIVYNFDWLTYSYIFYCTYSVIAISIIGRVLRKFKERKRLAVIGYRTYRHVLTSIATYMWYVGEIFLDQENLNPIRWSDRLVWFHYCLACFITISGFFLNLMSTEMVAISKLPQIETIADLFEVPHFSSIRPAVIANLPSFGVIKIAHANTYLGKLDSLLNVNPNYSLFYPNPDDSNTVLRQSAWIQGALDGDETCLISTDYVLFAARIGLCSTKPDRIVNIHESQSFAEGIMAFYFNKQLTDRVVKYLSNRYSITMEAGLYGKYGRDTVKAVARDILGGKYGWPAMKCFEKLGADDRVLSDEQLTARGLKLKSTKLTFRLCSYCAFASAIIMAIELVMGKKQLFKNLLRYSIRKPRKLKKIVKRRVHRAKRYFIQTLITLCFKPDS